MKHQKRVEAFMVEAGQEILPVPAVPCFEVRILRAKLHLEECIETINALGFDVLVGAEIVTKDTPIIETRAPDLIEIVDGCADVSVISMGTLSACGVNAGPVLKVVDESNLAKFGPGGHLRPDGKWMKPAGWKAPDILGVLRKQGYEG